MFILKLIAFFTGKLEKDIMEKTLIAKSRRRVINKVQFYLKLEKKPSLVFFSFLEMLALFATSVVILYSFFPKGELEKYVLGSREVNIDLSIKYLYALSKASQNQEERKTYKSILIEKLITAGRFNQALYEIENLEKEGFTKEEIAKFKLSVAKRMYLQGKLSKEELYNVFEDLYKSDKRNVEIIDFLLSESISLGLSDFYRYLVYDLVKDRIISLDKKLFFKLLDLSLANLDYATGEKLIDAFGRKFIGDREAEIKMIKYLLMTGKPQKASQLVNMILEGR